MCLIGGLKCLTVVLPVCIYRQQKVESIVNVLLNCQHLKNEILCLTWCSVSYILEDIFIQGTTQHTHAEVLLKVYHGSYVFKT